MYLLDTNVVSELRKAKLGKADARVLAWAAGTAAEQLYISTITVLEIELGVLLRERRDPVQGSLLRAWFDGQVLPAFDGRTLPIDVAVARCAARLHVPDPRSERDTLIGATALVHGLTVVTRNEADFRPLQVPLLNPWGG